MISGAPPVRAPNDRCAVSPPGAVTDRHPTDRTSHQVCGPEAHRQPAGCDPSGGLVAEVDAGGVRRGEARVGERQRNLRQHEGRGRDHEGVDGERRQRDRRRSEGEVGPPGGHRDRQPCSDDDQPAPCRRPNHATPATATPPVTSHQVETSGTSNEAGGSATRPHATFRKRRPTAICTPRITERGNTAAARSSSPVAPSATKTTPMRIAPAAISSTPSPRAIAMAPKALSGWTGIGKPVAEGTDDVEQRRREQHGRRGQTVRHDERDGDRHQDAQVGHGARPLVPVEPEAGQRPGRPRHHRPGVHGISVGDGPGRPDTIGAADPRGPP